MDAEADVCLAWTYADECVCQRMLTYAVTYADDRHADSSDDKTDAEADACLAWTYADVCCDVC